MKFRSKKRSNPVKPKPSLNKSSETHQILQDLLKPKKSLNQFLATLQPAVQLFPQPLHALLNLSIFSRFFSAYFPSPAELTEQINSFLKVLFSYCQRPIRDDQLEREAALLIDLTKSQVSEQMAKDLQANKIFALLIITELLQIFQYIPIELGITVIKNFAAEFDNILNLDMLPTLFSLITNSNAPFLPIYSHKKFTLVLDLDNTLGFFNKSIFCPRPGAQDFVCKMNEVFEVVLFTAAEMKYANWAMRAVDPGTKILLRLYRQHLDDGFKNLMSLGRDMEKVIIVDDFKLGLKDSHHNFIEIKPWTGNCDDNELAVLGEKLFFFAMEGGYSVYEFVSQFSSNL